MKTLLLLLIFTCTAAASRIGITSGDLIGTWHGKYHERYSTRFTFRPDHTLDVYLALVRPFQEHVMGRLRYSINVTLDGLCDHRAIRSDEDLHRQWAENLAQADALLYGRLTYETMEAAWRPAATGAKSDRMADWMEPFARTIDAK